MTAPIAFGLISENRKEPAVIGPQCPNANVRIGSLADLQVDISLMSASGWKADVGITAFSIKNVHGLGTRRRCALGLIPEQPLFDRFFEVFGEGEEGEAERDCAVRWEQRTNHGTRGHRLRQGS